MTQERDEASRNLTRWANIGERDAPTVFVGREQEIDLAISQLATWQAGASRGRTVVAQGAPGAGKTALLNEIGRRLGGRLPGAAAIYRVTPWSGRSVGSLLSSLAERMLGASQDAFRTTTGSRDSVGATAVAIARHDRVRSTAPPDLSCWDDLETLFAHEAHRAKPTLLLVDEIQRMGEAEEVRDLLYHLHDQTTFPVVLVCGGLSTSAAHLRELGLSRLADANVLRIGALESAEAEQCLEQSLRRMANEVGIEGHADHWARQLAPQTHGWPQHVTCHIRAAASALRASGRLAFDDANLEEARERAHANMQHYYEQRLDSAGMDATIVFAVHEAARGGQIHADDAADLVNRATPTLTGSRRSRHEARFPDAMDCVQRMLHAGVVAYSGNTATSTLAVPIPSLATYIASLLSREQRKQVRKAAALPASPDCS